MKRLVFIFPLILSGCIYVKRDIGFTKYQYAQCQEYFDAEGNYHKDCPKPFIKGSKEFLEEPYVIIKKEIKKIGSSIKNIYADKNEPKKQTIIKKSYICSKDCIKSCFDTRKECIKKCCYEKK